jgi:hypothetical protein
MSLGTASGMSRHQADRGLGFCKATAGISVQAQMFACHVDAGRLWVLRGKLINIAGHVIEDLHGKGIMGEPHLVELDDRLRGTLYGHWYTLGT